MFEICGGVLPPFSFWLKKKKLISNLHKSLFKHAAADPLMGCMPLLACEQISELLAELADERSTSESASQLLETETSERLRLEKDMKDLQAHAHKKDIKHSLFSLY